MLTCQISPPKFIGHVSMVKKWYLQFVSVKTSCILQGKEGKVGETGFSNGSVSWKQDDSFGTARYLSTLQATGTRVTLALCVYSHNRPSSFNSSQGSLPVATILGTQHTGQGPIRQASVHRGTVGHILYYKPFQRLLLFESFTKNWLCLLGFFHAVTR